jgi:hypothetical protein
MINANTQAARRDERSDEPNTGKVRKIVEDLCTAAGTSIAVEERTDGDDKSQPGPRRRLHITYTGERPIPYAQWFKLVDSIDTALDPTGLIDWEYSELSEELENERMAVWAILPVES